MIEKFLVIINEHCKVIPHSSGIQENTLEISPLKM